MKEYLRAIIIVVILLLLIQALTISTGVKEVSALSFAYTSYSPKLEYVSSFEAYIKSTRVSARTYGSVSWDGSSYRITVSTSNVRAYGSAEWHTGYKRIFFTFHKGSIKHFLTIHLSASGTHFSTHLEVYIELIDEEGNSLTVQTEVSANSAPRTWHITLPTYAETTCKRYMKVALEANLVYGYASCTYTVTIDTLNEGNEKIYPEKDEMITEPSKNVSHRVQFYSLSFNTPSEAKHHNATITYQINRNDLASSINVKSKLRVADISRTYVKLEKQIGESYTRGYNGPDILEFRTINDFMLLHNPYMCKILLPEHHFAKTDKITFKTNKSETIIEIFKNEKLILNTTFDKIYSITGLDEGAYTFNLKWTSSDDIAFSHGFFNVYNPVGQAFRIDGCLEHSIISLSTPMMLSPSMHLETVVIVWKPWKEDTPQIKTAENDYTIVKIAASRQMINVLEGDSFEAKIIVKAKKDISNAKLKIILAQSIHTLKILNNDFHLNRLLLEKTYTITLSENEIEEIEFHSPFLKLGEVYGNESIRYGRAKLYTFLSYNSTLLVNDIDIIFSSKTGALLKLEAYEGWQSTVILNDLPFYKGETLNIEAFFTVYPELNTQPISSPPQNPLKYICKDYVRVDLESIEGSLEKATISGKVSINATEIILTDGVNYYSCPVIEQKFTFNFTPPFNTTWSLKAVRVFYTSTGTLSSPAEMYMLKPTTILSDSSTIIFNITSWHPLNPPWNGTLNIEIRVMYRSRYLSASFNLTATENEVTLQSKTFKVGTGGHVKNVIFSLKLMENVPSRHNVTIEVTICSKKITLGNIEFETRKRLLNVTVTAKPTYTGGFWHITINVTDELGEKPQRLHGIALIVKGNETIAEKAITIKDGYLEINNWKCTVKAGIYAIHVKIEENNLYFKAENSSNSILVYENAILLDYIKVEKHGTLNILHLKLTLLNGTTPTTVKILNTTITSENGLFQVEIHDHEIADLEQITISVDDEKVLPLEIKIVHMDIDLILLNGKPYIKLSEKLACKLLLQVNNGTFNVETSENGTAEINLNKLGMLTIKVLDVEAYYAKPTIYDFTSIANGKTMFKGVLAEVSPQNIEALPNEPITLQLKMTPVNIDATTPVKIMANETLLAETQLKATTMTINIRAPPQGSTLHLKIMIEDIVAGETNLKVSIHKPKVDIQISEENSTYRITITINEKLKEPIQVKVTDAHGKLLYNDTYNMETLSINIDKGSPPFTVIITIYNVTYTYMVNTENSEGITSTSFSLPEALLLIPAIPIAFMIARIVLRGDYLVIED